MQLHIQNQFQYDLFSTVNRESQSFFFSKENSDIRQILVNITKLSIRQHIIVQKNCIPIGYLFLL